MNNRTQHSPNHKHWLVTLTMHLGEYEKTSHHVVSAVDEYAAWNKALVGECHNECHLDDAGECWDGDEFKYIVYDSHQLTDEEYEIFKRYHIGGA